LARPIKASWDVIAWANGHNQFPHDSTAHQLYGDEEFEAYRCLGELAATEALALILEQSAAEGPVGPQQSTPTGERPSSGDGAAQHTAKTPTAAVVVAHDAGV
jgi:hypothetical protein